VWWAALAAHRHPGRVAGLFALGPTVRDLITHGPDYGGHRIDDKLARWTTLPPDEQAARYERFMDGFFRDAHCEPHSTKQIEDILGWTGQTGAPQLIAGETGELAFPERADRERIMAGLGIPVMVVHGSEDRIATPRMGRRLAELTGGDFVPMEGAGHLPAQRFPVPVTRWIRGFADRVHGTPAPARTWSRPLDRPRRLLYVSSAIGLGHTRRDLAVARALREHHPDLVVDWLAQHPTTTLLAEAGERVHPASATLASESAHWESECDDHDLHAFQALRRMDEVLTHNFMVYADVADAVGYDAVVADEAWDVDHFLHENPSLKRSAYVWMTDFVGNLPMPDGGGPEAALTADYNAEMIAHIARYPRLRDRSLFVGDPDDVVADRFGPDLPAIRDWTEAHYAFPGYVTGVDPAEIADRAALRAEFGWRDDERVCLVAVGGTAVGEKLLRRAVAAHPALAARIPGLRLVVVTGPRLDPASLGAPAAVETHAYLPRLYRYLAAADVAFVQGGLTTTMELVTARRPFVYVPLGHHFEQQFHVPHRLRRYRAGHRLDYGEATPDRIADAVATALATPVDYRPVAADGAARAAAIIAGLL
jgi:predicted glycosyltransferase